MNKIIETFKREIMKNEDHINWTDSRDKSHINWTDSR